ncbi:uncharacterized protein BCR38DRAFT_437172 [Pseudomassariella vexata]|uniref:DUF3074 domain-containing protein n=1 Tax=Pseudomassariella vexata TaxID=1141098 RepID=A0A1Y2DY53_9PEZI|nr:uncharacterized protein BCR38DRAFT_437172 [Pseudomassariella vexata]ORY63565.1 hypothetical protein BCR38DRAFT_437172 [Pseudomassariella vexata]
MSPNTAHEAFKALAPIDWDKIDPDDVGAFMKDTFGDAQCLIDSIPISLTSNVQQNGRPRSATDPVSPQLPGRAPNSSERAQQLRKEWKEVQVNPRDNPLGVNVYRLGAKDKKGAWFARRSIHEGLSFEKWKLGMEREFAESLKVQGKPGDGKIRGIGADKRVVNTVLDGVGKMEVYQLSAQFPGPTTPRDFITLLLSSDCGLEAPMQEGLGKPRYFMVVSKPCIHPECPQRNGYIRGQYESVEFIREIKVEKPLRKVRSSIDLAGEEAAIRAKVAEDLNKKALTRSASTRGFAMSSSASDAGDQEGRKRGRTIAFAGTGKEGQDNDEESETLVEWLMVTRSDPGGSVPRFMVEKGTPAGIAGDAEKFLKWVSSAHLEDFSQDDHIDEKTMDDATEAHEIGQQKRMPTTGPTSNVINNPAAKPGPVPVEEQVEAPGGFYGMIANALGAAGSAFAARLPAPFGSAKGGDTDSDLSTSSLDGDDTTSDYSFHSFASDHEDDSKLSKSETNSLLTPTVTNGEAQSTHSSESAAGKYTVPSQHEKDLRKLEDRRRKLQEKLQRSQERTLTKKEQDAKNDESALAKLREKHEREVAKQEEKYRRDLKRLEEKRAHDQRKAEERKRKAAEREEKRNISMELEKTRAERDMARKQIDILKEQVGELQSQNTLLVAKLGKAGSAEALEELRKSVTYSSREGAAEA